MYGSLRNVWKVVVGEGVVGRKALTLGTGLDKVWATGAEKVLCPGLGEGVASMACCDAGRASADKGPLEATGNALAPLLDDHELKPGGADGALPCSDGSLGRSGAEAGLGLELGLLCGAGVDKHRR